LRSELDLEIEAHDVFARDHSRNFVGRKPVLDAITEYLKSDDHRPLLIYGVSGSGKSAIMAHASHQEDVVRRFLGTTPQSSNGATLLQTLCQEIAQRYRRVEDVPAGFNDLAVAFSDCLKYATAERPLIILIDALDQLAPRDPAAIMNWLPLELPANCKVVVSTTEIPAALEHAQSFKIEPFPLEEAGRALQLWLEEIHRTLLPWQMEILLANYRRSPLPLYLKLVFEEARRWRSFEDAEQCVLGDGLEGVVRRLFDRLSQDSNHGSILVSHAIGYLTAARRGLAEDEILALLSADEEVWTDFLSRARHEPPERQLPGIVWSRLFLDLEPYLTERRAPGGNVISFFHKDISALSLWKGRPLSHRLLASYFVRQISAEENIRPSPRSLDEVVYQLLHAGLWDDAYTHLTAYRFLQRKLIALGPLSLVEDISMSLSRQLKSHLDSDSTNNSAAVLWKLQRMLLQNLVDLEKYPGNLATLLYGYFVNAVEPALTTLLSESRQQAEQPWLRPLLPTLGRSEGSHIFTFQEGTRPVRAIKVVRVNGTPCVVLANDVISVRRLDTGEHIFPPVRNPSGYTWSLDSVEEENGEALLLSGGDDGRVRALNLASGTEALPAWWDTDQYHNIHQVKHLTAVRYGNQGGILVFTSSGRIWDLRNRVLLRSDVNVETGQFITSSKHGVLLAGMRWGGTCVESVDGQKNYRQAGRGRRIDGRPWNAPEAREISTTVGILPFKEGRPFVAVSYEDGSIEVLDATTNDELFAPFSFSAEHELARCLDTCATSGGRVFLAAGFHSGAVKVWDVATRELVFELDHDREPVFSLAIESLEADRLVVATGGNERAHVFQLSPNRSTPLLRTEGYADSMDIHTVSDRALLIAIAAQTGQITFFDGKTGHQTVTWSRGRRKGINILRFYEDPGYGESLLLVSDLERLRFWALKSQREVYPTIECGKDWITGFCPYTDPATRSSIVCLGHDSGSLEFRSFTGEQVRAPIRAHRNGVFCLVYAKHPETGKGMLITASADCAVRLFDCETFADIVPPLVHYGFPWHLALHWQSNGEGWLLAVACADNTTHLWELPSGKRRCPPLYHARSVCDVAILPTPNGSCNILTAGTDHRVKLWSSGGELLQTLPFSGQVICCRANSDFRCFAVLETLGQAHIFGLEDSQSKSLSRRSPDLEDNKLRVIDRTWACAHRIDDGMVVKHVGDEYSDSIRFIGSDPVGDKIVTVGAKSPVVRVWEPELHRKYELKLGAKSLVTAIAACEWEGREIVLAGNADGSVAIVIAETSEMSIAREPYSDSGGVNGIVIMDHRNGAPLTFASSDRTGVHVYSVPDFRRPQVFSHRLDIDFKSDRQWIWKKRNVLRPSALALGHNPDTGGPALFVGMDDGTVTLYDVEDSKMLKTNRSLHESSVTQLAVGLSSASGCQVAVSLDARGDVNLWDPLSGHTPGFVRSECRVVGMTLLSHPRTGKLVIATVGDCSLEFWDGETLVLLHRSLFEKPLTAVAAVRTFDYPSIVVGDAVGFLRQFEIR